MKNNITVAAMISLLVGCASMPGGVSSSKSSYDNSKEVVLEPGWATEGFSGSLKIGALKTSKMSAEDAVLVVRNDLIKNFASATPNLFIKVDSVEHKLSPLVNNTDCEISSSSDVAHCIESYPIKIALIEEMINAKEVKIKLNLSDSYVEGSLYRDGMSSAKKGLKDFLAKVKQDMK
jgi:hypothetical protein